MKSRLCCISVGKQRQQFLDFEEASGPLKQRQLPCTMSFLRVRAGNQRTAVDEK